MAVKIITVPDGRGGYIEVYTAPLTTKDANEWLKRVGATHLKFTTSKGKALLKNNLNNQIILSSDTIGNLCYAIAFQPLWMKKYGIPYYDWYRPDSVYNNLRGVIVHM